MKNKNPQITLMNKGNQNKIQPALSPVIIKVKHHHQKSNKNLKLKRVNLKIGFKLGLNKWILKEIV